MADTAHWQKIGEKILLSTRTELMLQLPFLDAALCALPHERQGNVTPTLATDTHRLFYQGDWLAQQYERGRTVVCRAYLHTILHCLLHHPSKLRGRDRDLWDLACDIAVESILDSLPHSCLVPLRPSIKRQHLYQRLHGQFPVITAQAVYRYFLRERLQPYDCAVLAREFIVDDHSLWPEEQGEREEEWKKISEQTQTAMDTVFSEQATGGQAVREQLSVSTCNTADFRAFLRRFACLREEMHIDVDAFDYGYYAYGLRHFGNMPLIEPLETREVKKIEDFVIAIDTSMSTSGELVRRFLSTTYTLLCDQQSFFRSFHLRILQCDDTLRSDTRIRNAHELVDYMASLSLVGQSATDFRPVFEHVGQLIHQGAFHRLRGLLYFTDGLGIYPQKRPPFDAAFVMLEGQAYPERVPPWGIRVILREDELVELAPEREEPIS